MNKLINYAILTVTLVIALTGASLAQTINAKGTSGAPVSVNSATTVLDFKSGRKGWCIEPETVSVRCEPSNSSAAPATTPTSSVGFLFPSGTVTCHNDMPVMAAITNAQIVRLDCASTGSATNVDSWEE